MPSPRSSSIPRALLVIVMLASGMLWRPGATTRSEVLPFDGTAIEVLDCDNLEINACGLCPVDIDAPRTGPYDSARP